MQLVTFTINGPGGSDRIPRVGAILPGSVHILDFAAATAPEISGIPQLSWLDMDGVPFKRALAAYEKARSSDRDLDAAIRDGFTVKRSDVTLLAPVPRPGKVICIGLNYRDHAEESNMPIPERPIVFSKFSTSVIGPGQAVVVPSTSEKVDYEAELAVVVGRYAKNVSLEGALDCVLGYTIVNDVSARDFQFADGQWQRGKSCDTFAPMGENITTADEIPDPQKLSIKLRLNGNTMQDSNTDQLIFGVRELVAFLSETIMLEPGDIIATGTPPGVGFARKPPVFIKDGDVMEVEIEGLGILTNPVIAAAF